MSGELARRKGELLALLAPSRYPPSDKALSVYSNGCDSEKRSLTSFVPKDVLSHRHIPFRYTAGFEPAKRWVNSPNRGFEPHRISDCQRVKQIRHTLWDPLAHRGDSSTFALRSYFTMNGRLFHGKKAANSQKFAAFYTFYLNFCIF